MFTTTTNGAKVYANSGSQQVDLFFGIGALRPSIAKHNTKDFKDKSFKDTSFAESLFSNALLNDSKLAAAILLWARDIRHGGAGEREVFKLLWPKLLVADTKLALKVLKNIVSVGRFDDLRVAYGTPLESDALEIWSNELKAGNKLAFKWADRSDRKLRTYMSFLNEAGFRKFISAGRKNSVVEQAMCSKNYSSISYDKLPSVAGARYAGSFKKNDFSRYEEFLGNKNAKMNASVLYPYDAYRTYKSGNNEAASKAWENMTLDIAGNILCIADVSGSMSGAKASGSLTCMDICVSLAAFIAQRCKGKFQNKLMTFSENPKLASLPATNNLSRVFDFVERMDWGMSTNLEKAYKQLIDFATMYNVPQSEMPEYLLVMSDMQFNSTCNNSIHFDNMKKLFSEAGYNLPKIVWWNLNAKAGTPVKWQEKDVCMVSGFSPNILKVILSGNFDELNPYSLMMKAIQPFIDMLDAV